MSGFKFTQIRRWFPWHFLFLVLLITMTFFLLALVWAGTVKEEPFNTAETLADGLGPRFNLDSCGGCHAFPSPGGTSPPTNPQFAIATAFGAQNVVPSFITRNGPIREARFTTDNQVHQLYTITGSQDGTITGAEVAGCHLQQEDFAAAVQAGIVRFRIPTQLFGSGLIEDIPDSAIITNFDANTRSKEQLGITGKFQIVDGRIGRFGWKAQHSTLLGFASEAYNVEMGVTNQGDLIETDLTPGCQFASEPNDTSNDVQSFVQFMRALPAPIPDPSTAATIRGKNTFVSVGCGFCHTPVLGGVPLYSDLLLHSMGFGLADGITQEGADGTEFRTAPLWGLRDRLFLLHDGRTMDITDAIEMHASAGSEANGVIALFGKLSATARRDLLLFLEGL